MIGVRGCLGWYIYEPMLSVGNKVRFSREVFNILDEYLHLIHQVMVYLSLSNGQGMAATQGCYKRRLGSFFGFKILNFNIFWGFQKNEYFLGFLEK